MQKHAIRKYTKNSLESDYIPMKNRFYYQLNNYMEGNYSNLTKPKDFYKECIEEISNAISGFHIKESFVAFRGADADEFPGEIGEVVNRKSFLSSSINPDKAFKKEYQIAILSDERTKCAFIGNLSRAPDQMETLFDKNSNYEILYKKGKYTVARYKNDNE